MKPVGTCMDERNRLSFDTPEVGATVEQIVQALWAVRAYQRCPLAGQCPVADRVGVIADGQPYNHKGVVLPRCERCRQWIFGRRGTPKRCRLCVDRVAVKAAA